MGIIWNLYETSCTFRTLQTRCESISPTVLNTRIKELRAAHIIINTPNGYALTEQGRSLYMLLSPLGDWSKEWVLHLRE